MSSVHTVELCNIQAGQLLDDLQYDATPRNVEDIDDFFLPRASIGLLRYNRRDGG